MSEYIVTRKSDGEEVYRYRSDAPIEWDGMEFATHDHVLVPPAETPVIARPVQKWSQTAWKRRFSLEERLAIRDAAAVNAILSDYMDLMAGTPEIFNDDPDTIRAVRMLEQAGLIAPGRADEVLYG